MARRLQIVFVLFLVLAGIRLFVIYRARHAPAPGPKPAQANPNFSADDYVVPKRAHAYDLKSAKDELDGKGVWVKAGNQVSYYPDKAGRVDFKHPVGLLPPLKKLDIVNVIQVSAPEAKGEEIAPGVRVHAEQVLAVFRLEGSSKSYAAPIGGNRGGDYTLYINDMLYLEDPHELYKHWPPDVWAAIERHQAKPGMNELQVGLALGAGVPQGGFGDYGNRTLQYDNNGHPVKVTFERNHATEVQNAAGS